MRCLYNTERDLIDRLHGTLCRYGGKVRYVSVEGKTRLILCDPVTHKRLETIKPDDPEFDISSPEIGYFNHEFQGENSVLFIQRHPYRRYRQGLYGECCSIREIDGTTSSKFSPVSLMNSKGLIDSIEGTFPSFFHATRFLSTVRKGEIAISRNIAFKKFESGVTFVYCEKEDIGFILPNGSTVMYAQSDTSWVLDQVLRKAGIRSSQPYKNERGW